MKTNPIGQFLSKIPKQAIVLGFKGYRAEGAQELRISYRYKGVVYNQSISVEGGKV